MKVIIFSAFYIPGFKGGGPIKTIRNLTTQLSDVIEFSLVTSDRDLGDSIPYSDIQPGCWNNQGSVRVLYVQPGLNGFLQMARSVKESECDIVYLNSFFSFRFSFIPFFIAKVYRKKVILSPRGEFSQGALDLKYFKKSVFIRLYKACKLHYGSVFQASTLYEAAEIRAVLGEGVRIRIAENIGSEDYANFSPSVDHGALRIVFISRITPKKNLHWAINILSNVKCLIEFDIFGSIEDRDYWNKCLAAIERLPPHVSVKYKGELRPNQVVNTISNYNLFFFPTKGENYGHVIAEALCAGLPVLIANTTPWRKLEEQCIGWDLPLNAPDMFCSVIESMARKSAVERDEIRKVVLSWARDKFSQRNSIDENLAMFLHVYDSE